MQRSASVALATLAIAAAALTPAMAAPTLSDVAYMQAARCAGLAQGAKLDTHGVDALLNTQGVSRTADVLDRADALRDTARLRASRAGPLEQQAMAAEMAGACQPYLGQGGQAAAGPAPG